ncbi:uncharacterized protein LOC113642761 [Tachysurus ichikawai]
MVDRTTRWPEAVPLTLTTTAAVARAFIDTWVARFGTPSDISSDRGPQFTSELWTEVARILEFIAHRNSLRPPYDGLFRVLEAGAKTFLVDVGGRTERVTVDRLKPAHGELGQPMVLALAPRRGRPTTNNGGDPKKKSQTVPAVLPATGSHHCTCSGKHVRAPSKLMLPLLVNSGGACVVADTNNPQITDA